MFLPKGEGYITSGINYDFVIRNGTVSVFDIFLENRIRILSVDGKGMKRWELVEAAPSSLTAIARADSKLPEEKRPTEAKGEVKQGSR